MFVDLTQQMWLSLCFINDRAFQKALRRPEFSRTGKNGQRQINVFWLFPWAWSDVCGNARYFVIAAAIRAAWPAHAWFNRDIFLPEARRQRYL
jgi:hypothetical protein